MSRHRAVCGARMNITRADVALWEAVQAKRTPAWVRKLDAERAKSYGNVPREARLARLVHDAINQRLGWPYGGAKTRPKLDQRNAISLLQLVRKNQERARANGYWIPEPDGSQPPRTLAEYMRRCTCERRAPYYRRWLRRLNK